MNETTDDIARIVEKLHLYGTWHQIDSDGHEVRMYTLLGPVLRKALEDAYEAGIDAMAKYHEEEYGIG